MSSRSSSGSCSCSRDILQGLDVATILSTLYVPVVVGDIIGTIILVPVLVYAWEPVKAQLGQVRSGSRGTA